MVESFTLGLRSENLDDLSASSECLEIWHVNVGFESRSPLLALSVNSCVPLGKLLGFSEAVFLCKLPVTKSTTSGAACGLPLWLRC